MGTKVAAKHGLWAGVLFFTGCATGPDLAAPLMDENQVRMQRELNERQSEIRRLKRYLEMEKAEPEPELAEQAPEDLDAKVPLTVLKPQTDKQDGEEWPESPELEVLATSRHESMSWYQQGLELMQLGRFDEAVGALSRFLSDSPDHVYADRAQFLIGESYFRNREYALAIVADNRLLSRYPSSMKLPETLYRAALSHLALGQKVPARGLLRELLRQYPGDAMADKASKKLARLATQNKG